MRRSALNVVSNRARLARRSIEAAKSPSPIPVANSLLDELEGRDDYINGRGSEEKAKALLIETITKQDTMKVSAPTSLAQSPLADVDAASAPSAAARSIPSDGAKSETAALGFVRASSMKRSRPVSPFKEVKARAIDISPIHTTSPPAPTLAPSPPAREQDAWLERVPSSMRDKALAWTTWTTSPLPTTEVDDKISKPVQEKANQADVMQTVFERLRGDGESDEGHSTMLNAGHEAVRASGHGGQVFLKHPIMTNLERMKSKLACQRRELSTTANDSPPPASTTPVKDYKSKILADFDRLSIHYASIGDKYRSGSYTKACKALNRLKKPISSVKDVEGIFGIGASMKEQIQQIIDTGSLDRVTHIVHDPKKAALEELQKVWGFGPVSSEKMYNLGFTSVDEIRRGIAREDPLTSNLTAQQRIGIKHYEDLLKKVPRAETEQIRAIIQDACKRVYKDVASNLVAEVCGSYRRGAAFSSDIDVIITNPDRLDVRLPLRPLVTELEKVGLLRDALSDTTVDHEPHARPRAKRPGTPSQTSPEDPIPSSSFNGHTSETWMGVGCLPSEYAHASGVHRRLDLKSYPASNFAFAVLYFTGSGHFNRSMRWYAKKIGLKLSDKGLFPITIFPNGEEACGPSVDCKNEREIFHALGLEYRAPSERDCVDDVKKADGAPLPALPIGGVDSGEDEPGFA